MTTARLCAMALMTLALALPARADDCHLSRVASFDMSIDESGGVYVPMTIGDQNVNFLLDTGGWASMLTEQTVANLKLEKMALMGAPIRVFGGKNIGYMTTAHDIHLGRLKARSLAFLVLPDGVTAPDIGGVLAPDILRAYDDDFDFANGKFALFTHDHCPGRVVYWADDYAVVDFSIDDSGHIDLPVTLDGKEVDVLVDTGSSISHMNLEQAEDLFGFDLKSPDLKDLGMNKFGHAYRYSFKTMTFNGVTVNHPDLMLLSYSDSHMPAGRIILGMGILRQLHIFIAYGEHKMYVTPASATHAAPPPSPPAPAASSAPAASPAH